MTPDLPTIPPLPGRMRVVHAVLVVFAMALIGRAGYVQLFQRDLWRARARQQQVTDAATPAPRGDIEDVTGAPVAFSRELVKLAVAAPEVKDFAALGKALRASGVPNAEVRRAMDRKRRWVDLRGSYLPSRVASATRLRGVHVTRVGDREYLPSTGARQLLGGVGPDGHGTAGIEAAFDSLLQGQQGNTRIVKGVRGQRFESKDALQEPPQRGHTVRLTIHGVLQNICDRALADAVRRLRADGGDVVVLQPRTGEVLCLSGRRPGNAFGGATALIEPYEPGSTLKPFYAARLLEEGKASPDEAIDTHNGRYEVRGRVITDVHKAPRMTLRDVIRFSSNVGIVKFADRLPDGTIYELLRDLGFGTATGVPYPAEAAGTLREPRRWSGQSRASLAIGYELAVTPLQLAAAYATLANGGLLVAPTLVKEVRNAEGDVVWAHEPRMLRRVFQAKTVERLIPMLEGVVDSGTAVDASLASFPLAGKSGTARRTVNGRYGSFTYTSSFVGIFPARNPQYVVLAKVDNPREESIYGGKVAAPLAKAVIEGALAARDASLDWGQLVAEQRDVPLSDTARDPARPAGIVDLPPAPAAPVPPTVAPATTTFDLSKPLREAPAPTEAVVVPDVHGLSLRAAVRTMHRAGLQVKIVAGNGGPTSPPAGANVRPGTMVSVSRP